MTQQSGPPQIELPTKATPRLTQIELLTIMIYGAPKIGKSTWCSGAPNAIFLATEPGLAGLEVPQVPIDSWATLWGAFLSLRDKKHSYKTIVIDIIVKEPGTVVSQGLFETKYAVDNREANDNLPKNVSSP